MYNICPRVFLKFNQDNKVEGGSILAFNSSSMYIEMDIPHTYTLAKKMHKTTIACVLIHEYCHYINALTMSGKERVKSMDLYIQKQSCRRAEEYRNWTATKNLSKKLGLWNKYFYNVARQCNYASALKF
jgi:hypothetical protein